MDDETVIDAVDEVTVDEAAAAKPVVKPDEPVYAGVDYASATASFGASVPAQNGGTVSVDVVDTDAAMVSEYANAVADHPLDTLTQDPNDISTVGPAETATDETEVAAKVDLAEIDGLGPLGTEIKLRRDSQVALAEYLNGLALTTHSGFSWSLTDQGFAYWSDQCVRPDDTARLIVYESLQAQNLLHLVLAEEAEPKPKTQYAEATETPAEASPSQPIGATITRENYEDLAAEPDDDLFDDPFELTADELAESRRASALQTALSFVAVRHGDGTVTYDEEIITVLHIAGAIHDFLIDGTIPSNEPLN